MVGVPALSSGTPGRADGVDHGGGPRPELWFSKSGRGVDHGGGPMWVPGKMSVGPWKDQCESRGSTGTLTRQGGGPWCSPMPKILVPRIG